MYRIANRMSRRIAIAKRNAKSYGQAVDHDQPPIPDPFTPRDKHEFALALDWRLRDLGMNQAELARQLGTRPETVNGWVRGHRVPSSRRLVSGLIKITGIATPADPEVARRARVDLEDRVAALEAAVARLLASGASDGEPPGDGQPDPPHHDTARAVLQAALEAGAPHDRSSSGRKRRPTASS